jgi:adenylate kinase
VNLLVLGPQGSGKGTQAKRISEEFEIPHVSTGDMFRAAIAAHTELGRKVEPFLDSGALVPDDVTIALIRERLSEDDAQAGFVLDGFPRNLSQAQALDEMLAAIGRRLDAILFFDITDSVGMERALLRAQIDNRADDTHDVIATRLATYHTQTEPVIGHYRTTGKLVPVRAERTIEEVWNEVSSALQQVVSA